MKPAGERRSRASGERINIGALPPDRIRRRESLRQSARRVAKGAGFEPTRGAEWLQEGYMKLFLTLSRKRKFLLFVR